MQTVFLNVAKLDYDNSLDFAELNHLVKLTTYNDSSNDEILARVHDHEIIITKELVLSKDLIGQFPSCVKLICEAGTGYNNIDIIAATQKNIAVCNIPGYSTEAVAQLAITFILNLSASLFQQKHMLDNKNFSNFTKYLQVPHFELSGKTLGIIGAGAIGQHVIKLALMLGMNILVFSRTPREFGDLNVKLANLEEVLRQSDFVSLHCPLNKETRHIINRNSLNLIKPSAYIINTSRGQLINETDLIDALTEGKLAGAALDVQYQEPPEQTNPLFDMPNVIMTPHIGWRRFETRQRLINLVAANIASFIAGKPQNVINTLP